MIQDMMNNYKKEFLSNSKIILDNYKIKDGLYIKVNAHRKFEIRSDNHLIINNKKDADNAHIDKKDLFQWFKGTDYLSSILDDDTNKAVDLPARKIHSINPMTFFMKKDILPYIGKKPLEIEKILELINKYFDKLALVEEKLLEIFIKSNYVKKPKKSDKEEFLKNYFKTEVKYIKSDERKKLIQDHKEYMINNFSLIIHEIRGFSQKTDFQGYVKIFFDVPIDLYRKEQILYVMPRIFNVNKYNLFIDNKVIGLPSSNMNTNENKPFLLLRSMQCEVPFRTTMEDADIEKNFFQWMIGQGIGKEIKIDYDYVFDGTKPHKEIAEGYYFTRLNTKGEINDYDNVSFNKDKVEFKFENVLMIKEKNEKTKKEDYIQNRDINSLKELQQIFSRCFFKNRLWEGFKYSEPDIKKDFTGNMKSLFMINRYALSDFFDKGIDISLRNVIDKLTINLIREQINHMVQGWSLRDIALAYNLRISFLKYFEGERKGVGYKVADNIKNCIEILKNKLIIKDEFVNCDSDEEFYFLSGQLAYYILSQSKSQRKSFGLFEPILNCKNSSVLKSRLRQIFNAYKHAIAIDNIKFKNAMSMVMGYDADKKISGDMMDMLIAGLLANNIFYEKKEERKGA